MGLLWAPHPHLPQLRISFFFGVVVWFVQGIASYIYAGVFLHIICDQIDTYRQFRCLKVRSLIGDLLRYRKYIHALRSGKEKEYMIARRDSWWNHLESSLPPKQLKNPAAKCEILKIYSEITISRKNVNREWKNVF